MPKHFIFAIPYFSLLSAEFLRKVNEKINKKNLALSLLLILLILASFLSFSNLKHKGFFYKGPVSQFMDFKNENLPEDSVVVADSRIYRGQIVWLLNNMNYLEVPQGIKLLNNIDNLPGEPYIADVYFLECGSNDCGWGTIPKGSQLDINMRQFFDEIEKKSTKIREFKKKDGTVYLSLYKAKLELKREIIPLIKSTHVWFYTPLRYENMDNFIFNYEPESLFQKILDKFAYLLLWAIFVLSLLSIIYLIYKFSLSLKT